MPKKSITTEEYTKQLINKNIKVYALEEYRGADVKIKHKCTCGNEWYVSPSKVKQGIKCGCNKNKKITHEQYLQDLKDKNIKVQPLEKYQGTYTKIKHRCTCGNVWDAAPKRVKMGLKCGCESIKTHEQYLQDLKDKNIKVKPLEKYKGTNVKIKHQCTCGNVWSVNPNTVLSNVTCGCSRRFTHEKYIDVLKEKNIEVKPIEKYTKMGTKIKHRCTCGNTWDIEPQEVLKGTKCGCNKKTSHEKYLELLKEKNIKIKPLEKYKKYAEPIKHQCTCGSVWNVSPSRVVEGQHCGCKRTGHNIETYKNKKTILYYVNVNNMWKIGLSLFTRQTIEENILKKDSVKMLKMA